MPEYKAIPEAEDCSPTPRMTGFAKEDEVLAWLLYPKEVQVTRECEREAFKWCVWSVWREAPYIAWIGRFSPKLFMETVRTAFRRISTDFLPKCTWTGARAGSAKPLVCPTPPWRP